MNATSYSLRLAAAATARAYSVTKGLLALLGLAGICAFLALPDLRATPVQSLMTLGATLPAETFGVDSTAAAEPIQASVGNLAEEREQRALTETIAKRYRVAEQAVAAFVSTAYRAGRELQVDPVLVLAVMAVESRFNPVAESNVGAKGLMQVLAKFHLEKLAERGGEDALLEPHVNIYVGTQILREYLSRFGEIETALQMYVGSFDDPNSVYAHKVLAERARLEISRQRAKRESSALVSTSPGNV